MYDAFVIGGLVLDLSEEFDRYPKEGEEVFSSSFSSVIGGTAYNMGKTFLHTGLKPIVSAYIGDDLIGQHIEATLKERGFYTHLVKTREKGTGIVFSVLTPNDRTMFTYRGADSLFSFTDEMIDIARSSKVTCISSYVFMGRDTLNNIKKFINKIRDYTEVALSIADGVLDVKFSWIVDILSNIDILFLNEGEYEKLKNYLPFSLGVVITMGKKGAKYLKSEESLFISQKESVEKGRFTGAGDVFCAGFLSGRLKGLSIEDSLFMGNKLALSWIRYEFT